MRITFIAIILIGLTACTTMRNDNANTSNWRGKSADLLIQRLGAPKAISPATNGNTLFIYTTESHGSYPSSSSNPTTLVGPHGKAIASNNPAVTTSTFTVLTCTTTYEVNKQHLIVSVQSKGTQCY